MRNCDHGDFLIPREPVSFDECFPQIRDIDVEVVESGLGVGDNSRVSRYSKEDIEEHVACSSPLCHNGGFRLADIIRNMVRRGDREFQATRECQGKRGSPRGRNKNRNCCGNSFRIKITIEYKQTDGMGDDGSSG